MVHEAGGLCYYDGANLNAVMGVVRPGDMGFDCIHMNLHKTFATPHGGGGPGAGAVGCKDFLKEYLPHSALMDGKESTQVRSFAGNFLVVVRALTYLLTLGREGVREAAQTGILAGYPVIDFKATLVDGSYHDVDSSEMAFKIAGSMAFKEGCKQAKSVILEPIMRVEVTVPEEYMGDVIGDVNSRRGKMEGMEARAGMQIIRAFIPLAEMFGYATDLRSKTQGRGTYSMEPSHYEEVPKSILDNIVSSRAKSEE